MTISVHNSVIHAYRVFAVYAVCLIVALIQAGATKTLSETGAFPVNYDYRVYVIGGQSQDTRPNDSSATTEWRSTYLNTLGQAAGIRLPSADGQSVVSRQFSYNSKGQLDRAIDEDWKSRYFRYNGLGEAEYTFAGRDSGTMNSGESPDWENDRIERVTREYTLPTEENPDRAVTRYKLFK